MGAETQDRASAVVNGQADSDAIDFITFNGAVYLSTVYLAEDSPIAPYATIGLRDLGPPVGEVVTNWVDGADALAVFAQNQGKINLVLTDIMMPVLDGAALIRALKKIEPNLKIAAMSGLTNPKQAEELQNLNVKYFLNKPLTAEVLLKSLNEILQSKN